MADSDTVPLSNEPRSDDVPVRGDDQRLGRLMGSYLSDVAAYCRWRGGSEDDAQDAVSDVFLVAWRRLDDVPEGDAARVWLLATARRVIANERRARARRYRLVERLHFVEAAPVQWPVEMAPGEVADALRRLEPGDREILLLAEWEGMTSAEIGEIVGCQAVTARGRLHRARQRFRAVYETVSAGATDFSQPSPAIMTTGPPSYLQRQNGR